MANDTASPLPTVQHWIGDVVLFNDDVALTYLHGPSPDTAYRDVFRLLAEESAAMAHARIAQTHFESGRYREAVLSARLAVETACGGRGPDVKRRLAGAPAEVQLQVLPRTRSATWLSTRGIRESSSPKPRTRSARCAASWLIWLTTVPEGQPTRTGSELDGAIAVSLARCWSCSYRRSWRVPGCRVPLLVPNTSEYARKSPYQHVVRRPMKFLTSAQTRGTWGLRLP
jgi:hypothetical protein